MADKTKTCQCQWGTCDNAATVRVSYPAALGYADVICCDYCAADARRDAASCQLEAALRETEREESDAESNEAWSEVERCLPVDSLGDHTVCGCCGGWMPGAEVWAQRRGECVGECAGSPDAAGRCVVWGDEGL